MSEEEQVLAKQEIPDVFFPAALIAAKHNGKDMRALNLRHKIIRILLKQIFFIRILLQPFLFSVHEIYLYILIIDDTS